MITVTISGKAWRAEPIGGDPAYTPDEPGMRRLQSSAVKRRCGRGERVTITAEAEDLDRLAHWLECDGNTWLGQCDTHAAKAEARECLRAAAAIHAAIDAAAKS